MTKLNVSIIGNNNLTAKYLKLFKSNPSRAFMQYTNIIETINVRIPSVIVYFNLNVLILCSFGLKNIGKINTSGIMIEII